MLHSSALSSHGPIHVAQCHVSLGAASAVGGEGAAFGSRCRPPPGMGQSMMEAWTSRKMRSRTEVVAAAAAGGAGERQQQQVAEDGEEHDIGLDALRDFFQLSEGKWDGVFELFDTKGCLLHSVPTLLSATQFGRKDLISLQQTLHIKPAASKTRDVEESRKGGDERGEEWVQHKLSEVNKFHAGRSLQIGVFKEGKAFALSHPTAETLEKILRTGVLGEDDDESDESPKGVRLPSRRPALVSEVCLFSFPSSSDSGNDEGNAEDSKVRRKRAVFILDPRGLMDCLGIFSETKRGEGDEGSERAKVVEQSGMNAHIEAMAGVWEGFAVRHRTGLYGLTVEEEEVKTVVRAEADGLFIVESSSKVLPSEYLEGGATRKMTLSGRVSDGTIQYEGSLRTTFLPDQVCLTYPSLVPRGYAFYFELAWISGTDKRKRLVRTFDADGQVVSTTLISEVKISQRG